MFQKVEMLHLFTGFWRSLDFHVDTSKLPSHSITERDPHRQLDSLLYEDFMGNIELLSRESPGFKAYLYFFPAV